MDSGQGSSQGLYKGQKYQQWADDAHVKGPDFPEQAVLDVLVAGFEFVEQVVAVHDPADEQA